MSTKRSAEEWLSDFGPTLRQIAQALRRVVLDADPELSESIKWGNPAYEKDGLVCYLAATKAYVSLGFFRGGDLSDPDGILEGTGKKMRHVKIRNLDHINVKRLATLVRETVALNQSG